MGVGAGTEVHQSSEYKSVWTTGIKSFKADFHSVDISERTEF